MMRLAMRSTLSGSRRALLAVGMMGVFAIPTVGLLFAQTPQQVQRIAEQVVRRLDLQTEFPRGAEPFRFDFQLPSELLWVVIVVAIGILLYAFRDSIPLLFSRQAGGWGEDERLREHIEAGTPAAVLGTADDMAAEGRYVEAMHILLLQSLAEIRRRLDEQFADSLTSREILRSTKLSEAGRASLRDIIGRVEWTYFGKYPAGHADYLACRASFNALAQSLHGTAPA